MSINVIETELLIARLARKACAADKGVDLGHKGLVDEKTMAFHEGSAKAYRRCISLVIETQFASNAAARESEQKTS